MLWNYGYGVYRVLVCCWDDVIVQDVRLWWYLVDDLASGVSHGLGLRLGFSHIVQLWFWCLQGLSLSLGWCYKFYCSRMYGSGDTLLTVWWYFIGGLVLGVSHGLGLGLGFSHIVELWFWCLQDPRLSLGWCYKVYSPRMYGYGYTLFMVWCQRHPMV